MSVIKWGCGGCDRRWTSLKQAHCAKCHEHFASVNVSDHHDRGGECQHPAAVRNKANTPVYRLSDEVEGPVWRSWQANTSKWWEKP